MTVIKKIKEIKELGLFSQYKWDESLPPFKKYNVIYGWNGSGKTTLSNLFYYLEKKELPQFPNLQYKIESQENKTYTHKQEPFDQPIRVFNQGYVEKNVNLREGKISPIFILGEENKQLADKIEKDESDLKGLEEKLKSEEKEKEEVGNKKNNLFSSVAKTIKAYTKGNYTKTHAENDFKNLSENKYLEEVDLKKQEDIFSRQDDKKEIKEIEFNTNLNLSNLCSETKSLCERTVKIKVLEKLKKNPDISTWVEKGLEIHMKREECEFCGLKIPPERIDELLKHFNKADKELKEEIDLKIANIEEEINKVDAIGIPNEMEFYADLRQRFSSREKIYHVKKKGFREVLTSMVRILKEKKQKTTESMPFLETPEDTFQHAINSINEIVKENNTIVSNFQKEKERASDSIKDHYLSEISVEVKQLENAIKTHEKNISDLIPKIQTLKENIGNEKQKISSKFKACDQLNKSLRDFLGRSEISFEVKSEEGYILKRNGSEAENLSESEKTAIGFIHFIIHLEDQDFDLKNGIVVIDDPVSSLDSNSIHKAFSFLKNSVENAKQIFIFTHDFYFLRLILRTKRNWKGNFYMIKNRLSNTNGRTAFIEKLDKALENYETEYLYLFKLLNEFAKNEDMSVASTYPIPNIARKFLDTFLMLIDPGKKNTHTRLKEMNFDKIKKEAIFKFTNEHSHSTGDTFNPSLIPGVKSIVKDLLDMVKKTSPKHFKSLESGISLHQKENNS